MEVTLESLGVLAPDEKKTLENKTITWRALEVGSKLTTRDDLTIRGGINKVLVSVQAIQS